MGLLDKLSTLAQSVTGLTAQKSAIPADTRSPDTTRPRVQSVDPSVAIDKSDKTTILKYPLDLPKYYISFGFESYRRPSIYQGLSSKGITDYISLPLPSNLRDTTTYNYGQQDGWMPADAVTPSLQNFSDGWKTGAISSISQMTSASGDVVSAAGGALVGNGLNQLVSGVGGAAIGSNGVDAVKQILGLADNPFITVAFKGANFKTHQFQWRLVPRNAQEALSIRNIINTFKKVSAPSLLTAAVGGYYVYPDIVWVKLNPQELRDATYTFKPCMITMIDADWAPDRPSFYKDSNPLEVILSIGLMEIELWRNGDGTGLQADNGDFSNVDSPPVRDLGTH